MLNFLPPLIFFIGIFIAFAVVEFLVVAILNYCAKHYWVFFIDKIISARVHHGKALRLFFIALVLLVALLLWVLTPLKSIYQQSTVEMKWFAAALFLELIGVYFFTSRKIVRLGVERKIHLIAFSMLSLICYAFVLILAYDSYGNYQRFINAGLIDPAIEKTANLIGQQERGTLLEALYRAYQRNECAKQEAAPEGSESFRQFVYVGNDPETQSDRDPSAERAFVVGWKCEKDGGQYWRTENGKWYEILAVSD